MYTWEDVSIKTAQKIFAIKQEHPIARRVAIYAEAMGEDYDTLLDMSVDQFDNHTSEFRFLDSRIPSRRVDFFEGSELVLDMRSLTAGQLIDIETSTRDGNTDMARVLALLWRDKRPLKEKEEYLQENMPITIAKGVYDFFLRRTERLQVRSLRYFRLMLKIMKLRARIAMVFNRYFGGLFGSKRSQKPVI